MDTAGKASKRILGTEDNIISINKKENYTNSPMQRADRNSLIWHLGDIREDLLQPSLNRYSVPSCYRHNGRHPLSISAWNYRQVAEWITSIGMGQYSNLFVENMIDGIHLLTTDSAQILKMGVKNPHHALSIEKCIRQLNWSKRQAVGQIDTLPYFYYRALNLGHPPPPRYFGELLHSIPQMSVAYDDDMNTIDLAEY